MGAPEPGAAALPVVHVVCGPTAAGKSGVAMALATRAGLTIVSADSRQIYRGFDIGTAKPSLGDRARVPHRGIDVADPTERWSAARWSDDATAWIAEAGASRTLVVGGTGLYLRALAAPLFAEPPLDPAARAELAAELDPLSLDELRWRVEQVDPARAHLGRTQLLRAIEVERLTGRALSAWHRDASREPRWRLRYLLVDPGAALQAQIASRLDAMIDAGWCDETRALDARVPADAPAWKACGYAAMRAVVRGERSLAEARATILVETRQYAKRQRTWFRNQLRGDDVTPLDPRRGDADAAAQSWWEAARA